MHTNVIGKKKRKNIVSTRELVTISILSAIAYGLMFISMPIAGIFPEFLKIDLSDLPAIFGGIAFGPGVGFVIVFIKNFLQMITATTTGGVGEFAAIIIEGAYVLTACYIYKKRRDFKGLILGLVIGTVAMIIVGTVMNYYVLLPFYGKIMGLNAILGMGKAINSGVDSLFKFVIYFIAPFNLVKGIILSALSIPIYKKLGKHIHR